MQSTVAGGSTLLLIVAGCLSSQDLAPASSENPPASALEDSWAHDGGFEGAALRIGFDVGQAGTCAVRLGLAGQFPNGRIGALYYEQQGGNLSAYSVVRGLRSNVQVGTATTDFVYEATQGFTGGKGHYAVLVNISKERFVERTSNGDLTLSIIGLAVEPWEQDLLGPLSVLAEYSCEGDVRVQAAASREIFLVSQADFDRATGIGAGHASAVYEASSDRRYGAPEVEIVAGPGWGRPTGTASGALRITRPGGFDEWGIQDGGFHTLVDGPGDYSFELTRVGTDDPFGPCAPLYCPDLFFLAAVGWFDVATIRELQSLPKGFPVAVMGS